MRVGCVWRLPSGKTATSYTGAYAGSVAIMSGSKNRKHIRSRRGGAHARAAREITGAYDRTYGEDDDGFEVTYETKASGNDHTVTAWLGPRQVPYGDGYMHPEYYDKEITIRNMPDTLVAHVYVKNQDGTRGAEVATAETDITENLLDNMSNGNRYNGISDEVLPECSIDVLHVTGLSFDYDDLAGSGYGHWRTGERHAGGWDGDQNDFINVKLDQVPKDDSAFPEVGCNDMITALDELGGTPVFVPDKKPDSKLTWSGREIFSYMKGNMSDENGLWDRMTVVNADGSKSRYDRKREYDF